MSNEAEKEQETGNREGDLPVGTSGGLSLPAENKDFNVISKECEANRGNGYCYHKNEDGTSHPGNCWEGNCPLMRGAT